MQNFTKGTDSGYMTAFRIIPCFSCFPVLPSERQPMKIIRLCRSEFSLSDRHWAGTHSPDGRERRRRGTGNTLHTSAGYAGRAVDREAVHTGGGQGAIRGRADRIERRVGKPSETSDAERTV